MEPVADDTRGGFDAYIAPEPDHRHRGIADVATPRSHRTAGCNRPVCHRGGCRPGRAALGVFLGANMDAIDVGASLGFAPGKSLTYDADGDGVAGAWATTSYADRKGSRASRPTASIVFDDAERSGAQKKKRR